MAVRQNYSALDMQPGKVSESESMNISEESGGDEKDADVPEKVGEWKIHTKGTLKDVW